MTPADAAALLTIAASFDNRKPDADAARAWAVALDGLRVEDCRDAVIAHYRASSEWLMPAMVRAEVKRIRKARLAAHPAPTPPEHLSDAEQHEWRRQIRDRIAAGEVFPVVEIAAGKPPAEVESFARGWRAGR